MDDLIPSTCQPPIRKTRSSVWFAHPDLIESWNFWFTFFVRHRDDCIAGCRGFDRETVDGTRVERNEIGSWLAKGGESE